MPLINAYVSFNGNAEEAFTFYSSVFGTEKTMMRFKDVPQDAYHCSPQEVDKLMHCSLPIGKQSVLMGCDVPDGIPFDSGKQISLSLSADSKEDADRLFAGLAEGGKIEMPMDKTFWGAYFGMLTDRFGIHWMIDYSEPQ